MFRDQQGDGSLDRSDPMGDALGLESGARALALAFRRRRIDARRRRAGHFE
jgi:hypothetical protein